MNGFLIIIIVSILVIIIIAWISFIIKQPNNYRTAFEFNIGRKILVDLDKCEIHSNFLQTAIPKNSSVSSALIEGLNRSVNKKSENSYYDITHEYIWLTFFHEGKKYVSEAVRRNKEAVQIQLRNHKQTCIYCDEKDTGKYFFDLRFLANTENS